MNIPADVSTDVMQVCRNGHVVTDMMRTFPEQARSHCERCGADTLSRCATCGQELPGTIPVPGLAPIGRLQPPSYCGFCGAAFPWARRQAVPPSNCLDSLERQLRLVPLVIRQLRTRHGDRPPFRVDDEHDLEDLLRSLLPLICDDVRPLSRTPAYAPGTRTDFLLLPAQIIVSGKRATVALREPQLSQQLQEDVSHHRQSKCKILVVFVYDPEVLVREPRSWETAWSQMVDEPKVRCVIA